MKYRNLKHALTDIKWDTLAKSLQDLKHLGKIEPLTKNEKELERICNEYALMCLFNEAKKDYKKKGNVVGEDRCFWIQKAFMFLIDLAEQQDEVEKLEENYGKKIR